MTVEDILSRFGIRPKTEDVAEIREILAVESEKEMRGVGDTEVIRLLCIELFANGDPRDVFQIWRAKSSSWDASCSIDTHLLCGAGLAETKAFLSANASEEASRIFELISQPEEFDGFSVEEEVRQYELYYFHSP